MSKPPPEQPHSPSARPFRPRVTSLANPLIKLLRSLHTKKGRAETGWFLAEGARLIAEAADLGAFPEVIVAAEAALERPSVAALLARCEAHGARVTLVSEAALAQISRRDNPQTLIAAFPQRYAALERLDPAAASIFVALEGVRDPGNLGTILRTADAVGAGGVALIGQTCDPFSVEAVRATMGAIFAVPIVRCEFDALNAWRRAGGLALWGASVDGDLRHDAPAAGRGVVVLMGNEQSGLPEALEAACDARVRIPMRGRADSLNLAAATAVMLYDVWRRQGYVGARA